MPLPLRREAALRIESGEPMSVRFAVMLLFAAPVARAQAPDVAWERPVAVDPTTVDVVPVQREGAVVAISLPPAAGIGTERNTVPFVEPVHDWEVGKLPNGDLVVLAGGVKDDLTVYFVPAAGAAREPFRTQHGRRLGPAFGDGHGSWPLVAGPDLWVIAYQNDDRHVIFRALTTGRGLVRAELPAACKGFGVPRFDPRSFEFTVPLDGVDDVVRFVHPRAPKASIDSMDGERSDFGLVQLGQSVERRFRIRNVGGFPLRATVRAEPAGVFEVEDEAELELAAGAMTELVVRCAPAVAGEVTGQLKIESPVRGGDAGLALHVEGFELAAEPEKVPPVPFDVATAPPAPEADAAGTAPRTVVRPALRVPPPVVTDARVVWDGGRVAVSGVVRGPHVAPAVVLRAAFGRGEVVAPLAADGSFRARVPSFALEPIEVALASPSGAASSFVAMGRAPLVLAAEDGGLRLSTLPRQRYLLVQLTPGGLVLHAWRGRADARGKAAIPAAFFGAADVALHFAGIVRDPVSGGVARSAIVVLEPRPGAPR